MAKATSCGAAVGIAGRPPKPAELSGDEVTSWPTAAIAIAGIAFITIVVSVLIWQAFSTGTVSLRGCELGFQAMSIRRTRSTYRSFSSMPRR